MNKNTIVLAAFMGALSVLLGAFAAHTLRAKLEVQSLAVFETAVRYQFYHVFALLLSAILSSKFSGKTTWFKWSNRFFLMGIVLFSGSLYLISTKQVTGLDWKWLGPITPIGGLFLVTGWSLLALAVLKSTENKQTGTQE